MTRTRLNRLLPVLVLFITSLLLAACAPQPAANPPAQVEKTRVGAEPGSGRVSITVMAAASLTEAFTELGALFEADHPGVAVQFNFAGSQQLAQQLGQGAPADVFASANQKQMDLAAENGRVEEGSARIFAQNRLVVIYPGDNPAGLKELADLAQDHLKLVLAAAEVPVGQYSLVFLENASAEGALEPGYKEQVLANVVSYENTVKSVLTKVALGEADAGIVYTSDLTGPEAAQVGKIEIPDALNVSAAYPIAAVSDSRHPDIAQAFVDFVLSPAGQASLARYGFIPVEP